MLSFHRSVQWLVPVVIVMALIWSAVAIQPAAALAGPTVVSVTRTDTGPATSAGVVHFTVTFSVPVTGVDNSDFALAAGSIADASVAAFSGPDGNSIYTVAVNSGAGTGTIGLDVLNDGSIMDTAGPTPLASGFTGGDTYTVENPSVVSVTRLNANPSSAANVRFTVTFSTEVTGVNFGATGGDFSLTKTGVTGPKVTALAGSGTTYTVTVFTGSGNGTMRLNIVDNDTITGPDAGRALGGTGLGNGGFTAGETYTIKKIPLTMSPAASIWDTTPTYKWSKVPRATKYQYQLYTGTTLVYTGVVASTSCGSAACARTPTTLLVTGAYKWRVRALIDGTWKPYSPFKAFTLKAAVAGFWSPSSAYRGPMEFYVTADRAGVANFTVYVGTLCGIYKIPYSPVVPIKNGKFSFSGAFHANGTFSGSTPDATKASGTLGLTAYPIGGCSVTLGPVPYTAYWQNASQPAGMSLEDFGPILLPPLPDGSFKYLQASPVLH